MNLCSFKNYHPTHASCTCGPLCHNISWASFLRMKQYKAHRRDPQEETTWTSWTSTCGSGFAPTYNTSLSPYEGDRLLGDTLDHSDKTLHGWVRNLKEQRQQLQLWRVDLDEELFWHRSFCHTTCAAQPNSQHHELSRLVDQFYHTEVQLENDYIDTLEAYATYLLICATEDT